LLLFIVSVCDGFPHTQPGNALLKALLLLLLLLLLLQVHSWHGAVPQVTADEPDPRRQA
jgi:hypothetical protein